MRATHVRVVEVSLYISGSVYQCLKCPDSSHSKTENTSGEEMTWSALSNRALVSLIDQLLIHVAR